MVPELRCKIWKCALPGPRYIEIRSEGEYDIETPTPRIWAPCCTENAPVLFFVSKEARAEVTKRYQPFKGNEPGSATILCDFDKDYICFTYHGSNILLGTFLDIIPDETVKKIRNVGVDEWGWLFQFSQFLDGELDLNEDDSASDRQRDAVASRLNLKKFLLVGGESCSFIDSTLDLNEDIARSYIGEANAMFKRVKEKCPEWHQPELCSGNFVEEEDD